MLNTLLQIHNVLNRIHSDRPHAMSVGDMLDHLSSEMAYDQEVAILSGGSGAGD